MHDIHGEQKVLREIFCDQYLFRVPNYQRPYAWELDHTKALLADLLGAVPTAGEKMDEWPPYFLGSIVLKKEDGRTDAEIIDGQQRLTTLTMLLAALRESTSKEFSADMQPYLYQQGSRVTGAPERFRLLLRDQDRDFFRDYVQKPGGFEKLRLLQATSLSDPQAHIQENAIYLYDNIKALPEKERERLAMLVINRAFLVVVSTPTMESAFRIFSVLNDRGLDLTHSDILKADIVGSIEDGAAQGKYAKKWEAQEEELGREAFKELFTHLRMIHKRAKLDKTVLEEFREAVLARQEFQASGRIDGKKVVDTLILPGADAFSAIRTASYSCDDSKKADQVNRMLTWLARIDNIDWLPPAIAFLLRQTNTPDNAMAFYTGLERLAATFLILRTGVNDRIRRYAEVIKAIDDGSTAALTSSLALTANEKANAIATLDGPLYLETKVRLYVLLRLDEALSGGGATYDQLTTTVEHVYPQTPEAQSQWAKDFSTSADQALVHRIGNLLLLSRRKNSQAGRLDFALKKAQYFSTKGGISPFALTTQVLKEAVWTPAVVERRQSDLLTHLRDVWDLK